MEIILERKDATSGSLKITINESDYKASIDKKLKEQAKKIIIKGFRAGHAPLDVVKKMVGPEMMITEINALVDKAIKGYIQEKRMQIIGQPLPDASRQSAIDWKKQKDFDFYFFVGMPSEYVLNIDKSIVVDAYEVEIGEKHLDETIAKLTKDFSTQREADNIEEGDFVNGVFREINGDFIKTALMPLARVTEGSKSLFLGKAKDEMVEFDIKEAFKGPEDLKILFGIELDQAETLQGMFEFRVDSIKRSMPSELNKEFFDKVVGPETVDTEEEFRKEVRQILDDNLSDEAEVLFRKALREKILAATNIELPADFIKKLVKATDKQEGRAVSTDEEMEKRLPGIFEYVKWDLIQDKLAMSEQVQVEREEVEEAARFKVGRQLAAMGIPLDNAQFDGFVKNFLQSEGGAQHRELFKEVQLEKIFDKISNRITRNVINLDVDGFRKVVADFNASVAASRGENVEAGVEA